MIQLRKDGVDDSPLGPGEFERLEFLAALGIKPTRILVVLQTSRVSS
jgi:hypothetical protein